MIKYGANYFVLFNSYESGSFLDNENKSTSDIVKAKPFASKKEADDYKIENNLYLYATKSVSANYNLC